MMITNKNTCYCASQSGHLMSDEEINKAEQQYHSRTQIKHTELSPLTDADINLEDITKYFDIKDIMNSDDLFHPDHPIRSDEEVKKAEQQYSAKIQYSILIIPPEGIPITGVSYDNSDEILQQDDIL